MFRQCALAVTVFLLVCACASGRELIRLANGFTFEADSHSTDGTLLIAAVGKGTLQFSTLDVREITVLADLTAALEISEKRLDRTELPGHQVVVVRNAAVAQGLPEDFVRSVAIVESGLRQNAVSPKGALGLMQLMPATAAELHVDPRLAEGNATGGATYLRRLLLAYNGDSALALAAYNAGPRAVKKYGGIPPYRETQRYVRKVLAEYKRQLSLPHALATQSKPSALNSHALVSPPPKVHTGSVAGADGRE